MRPLCKDRSKGEALVSRKQESCLKLALSCLGALPSSPICPGDASFGKASQPSPLSTYPCLSTAELVVPSPGATSAPYSYLCGAPSRRQEAEKGCYVW